MKKQNQKKKRENPFERQDKKAEGVMIVIIVVIALCGLLMGYLMVSGMEG